MGTTTEKHYGEQLSDYLKEKKASKKRVATILCINYRTLIDRMEDGFFSSSQVAKLKEKGYIKCD